MPEPVDDAAGPGLQKLLAPRSIAIVGTGTFGNGLVRRVLEGGFPGPVHLVNTWYEQVEGLRCVPALAELPGPADLALLAVRAEHVEAHLRAAAGTGPGPRSSTPASSTIRARMPGWPRVASAVGMAVCGANCMGSLNLEQPRRACAYGQPAYLRPGPVTFISHSGSAFSALLHTSRGVRLNLVVSAVLRDSDGAAYRDPALRRPLRISALVRLH
jgi:acyl-CoA synthetase (NDP forming)